MIRLLAVLAWTLLFIPSDHSENAISWYIGGLVFAGVETAAEWSWNGLRHGKLPGGRR